MLLCPAESPCARSDGPQSVQCTGERNPSNASRLWAPSLHPRSFNRHPDLQIEHANALLCPCPSDKVTLQSFVLSVLQLMAGGCSSILAATNVLVSPKDMLLKCSQYACHHSLNAEALWDMMYSTPAQGGTGLDGIVQVVMKCMPQLCIQDAIRASALLLLQNSSHGCQVRPLPAELTSVHLFSIPRKVESRAACMGNNWRCA